MRLFSKTSTFVVRKQLVCCGFKAETKTKQKLSRFSWLTVDVILISCYPAACNFAGPIQLPGTHGRRLHHHHSFAANIRSNCLLSTTSFPPKGFDSLNKTSKQHCPQSCHILYFIPQHSQSQTQSILLWNPHSPLIARASHPWPLDTPE